MCLVLTFSGWVFQEPVGTWKAIEGSEQEISAHRIHLGLQLAWCLLGDSVAHGYAFKIKDPHPAALCCLCCGERGLRALAWGSPGLARH